MIVHAYYLRDARVRRYAETLSRKGIEVDVLCLREASEPSFEERCGVYIHRIPVGRCRGGMVSYVGEYIFAALLFFLKLNFLYFCRWHRYEIIHVHNFPDLLVFVTCLQKVLGTRVLLDVHDPMPELFQSKYRIGDRHPIARLLRLQEKLSISYADFVITANHYFKQLLESRNCLRNRIAVVMNAPDARFCVGGATTKSHHSRKDSFNVLYVGTVAERYGLDTMMEAVARLRGNGCIPQIRLTIVPKLRHEGDYLNTIAKEASALGLRDCFCLREPVPHDQMAEVYSEADILVYTPAPDIHMNIALSLKIPEAIAAGCPVVASRLSVLEKYFGEDALFMCEPGNVADCAAKIIEIYQNPTEASRRTKRAAEALEKFKWQKQAQVYEHVLKTMLESAPKEGHTQPLIPTNRMLVKKFLRKTVSLVTYCSGMSFVWNRLYARCRVRILAYHAVEKWPSNSYSITPANLDAQLAYLKQRYNVIPIDRYKSVIEDRNSCPPNTLVITFDDGFESFCQNAYPILRKYNLPATCFIITSKVESEAVGYMDWHQVREVAASNLVTIGSHTVHHTSLRWLDDGLKYEIGESKRAIQRQVGTPVKFFSYPYGTPRDFDRRCQEALLEYGYELACTSINGINDQFRNPLALRRTRIEWGDDISTFKQVLEGALDIWVVVDRWFGLLQNKGEVNFGKSIAGDIQAKKHSSSAINEEINVTCKKSAD